MPFQRFRLSPIFVLFGVRLVATAIATCSSFIIPLAVQAEEVVWTSEKEVDTFNCSEHGIDEIVVEGRLDLSSRRFVTVTCPNMTFKDGSSILFSDFIYLKITEELIGNTILISNNDIVALADPENQFRLKPRARDGVNGSSGSRGQGARCFSQDPLLNLRSGSSGIRGTDGHNGNYGRNGLSGKSGTQGGSALVLLFSAQSSSTISLISTGQDGANGGSGERGRNGGKGGNGGHGGSGGYGGFCVASAPGGQGGSGGNGGQGGDGGSGGSGGNGGDGGSLTVYLSPIAAEANLLITAENHGGTGGIGGGAGRPGSGGNGGQAGLGGEGGGKFRRSKRFGAAPDGANGQRGGRGMGARVGTVGMIGWDGGPGTMQRKVLTIEEFTRMVDSPFAPVTPSDFD